MAEEDQKQVLDNLFKAMKSWSREMMRDWIDEIMGEDESMKPVIDQLYERKGITNEELIEFFRGMVMTGDEPEQEEPAKTQKKPEPKASKKEKKKTPPSSLSSSASDKRATSKGKKRKLVVPESSESSDAESDATVDLSASRKYKTGGKGKTDPIIPAHKIKQEKLVMKETPKSKMRKLATDEDDSDDFQKSKYKKWEKVKIKQEKNEKRIPERERDKGDKQKDRHRKEEKLRNEKLDKTFKKDEKPGKSTEKDRHGLKDKKEKNPDKTVRIDAVKIKVEKDDAVKDKQSYVKDSLEKDRRDKSDNRDQTKKLESKPGRDKVDKTHRDKSDKPRGDRVRSDKELLDKEITDKVKSSNDKEKSKSSKDEPDARGREKERSDTKEKPEKETHVVDIVGQSHKPDRDKEKSKSSKDEPDARGREKERSDKLERSDTKEKPEKETHVVDIVGQSHKPDRDKVDRTDKIEKADKIEKPPHHEKYIDLTKDHFDPKEFKVSKPVRLQVEKGDTDRLQNISAAAPSEDIQVLKADPKPIEHEKHSEIPDAPMKATDEDATKIQPKKPDELVIPERVPLQTQFPRPKEEIMKIEAKETSRLGPFVRPRNAPVHLDPDYPRYRKNFKLRPVTVQLYDIRRQSLHWRSGDQVYRAQLAEERRKRKEQRKLEEKKEKYSERGTRILPFEKRPENAELYRKKGEITREKPKVQTQTEKERLLMELHRKDRDKEKEKKIKTINSEFKIPKKDEKLKKRHILPIIQDNIVSSITPLAPAAQLKAMSFDKNRLIVQQRETKWEMTPEEERALNGEIIKPKPKPMAPVNVVKEKEVVDFTADDDIGNFGIQDDGFQADDHDAEEGQDGSYCYPNTPPPPVSDVEVNDISRGVVGLLDEEAVIQPPQENCSHGDVIIRKIAKWFRFTETEPYYQTCPSIPEQSEENFYTLMMSMVTDEDDVSFVGNVSNPDGEEHDLQDSEITSTARDPDLIDEYCGAGLLYCQVRVKAGEGKDCYKNIFDVRRGCNYDKHNFQAKCNLCEELISDKRHLAAHIRGTIHRANMASTSLKLIGLESKLSSSEIRPISPTDTVMSKSSDKSRSQVKDKESKEVKVVKTTHKEKNGKTGSVKEKGDKAKTDPTKGKRSNSGSSHTTLPPGLKKPDDGGRIRRKSRSRSRSPSRRHKRSRSRGHRSRSRSRTRTHRRSRSRSPRGARHHRRRSRSRSRSPSRRRTSKDQIDEFLARNERAVRRSSPPKPAPVVIVRGKQETGDIFRERLILQGTGKWTPQLEARWKLWEDEEDRMKKIFAQKRKMLEEKPEDHPKYAEEWPKFWEKRYQELIDLGKDAETYDYAPEWKIYWGKLSEAFLDREMAIEMQEIRLKYGMDLNTLKALNAAAAPTQAVPPPATTMISPVSYGVPAPLPYMSGQPLPSVVPTPMNYPAGVTLLVPPPPIVPISGTPTYPGQAMPMFGVPPPVTALPAVPAVAATATTASAIPKHLVSEVLGVDYTTKSMSISSGSNISPYSDRVANLIPSVPKVTIDDIRSTWENLTGQKIQQAVVEKAKSVASGTSNKSKDYDFDGLDVVEVLRLMTGLEDELSFLAIKVLEYYKLAEKMESDKPRKSFALLKDVEFVTLIQQCRDKFFAMLKANVSSSDVMKKLNLTVFAMNALIDLPICQKIRPSVPDGLRNPSDPVSTIGTVTKQRVETNATLRNTPAPSSLVLDTAVPPKIPAPSKVYTNSIEAALADVSMQQKIEMSSVIAHSLIAQGKDRLSHPELMTTLLQIMTPILSGTASNRSSAGQTRLNTAGDLPVAIPGPPSGTGSWIGGSTFDRRVRDDLTRSTIPGPSRSDSGSELFPEIIARAVSPPAEKRQPQELKIPNLGLTSFLPNPFRGGGGGRRDYMGNPIPEDQDNTREEPIADIPFYRPRTNNMVSPHKFRDASPIANISTLHPADLTTIPSCKDPLRDNSRSLRRTSLEYDQRMEYPNSSGKRIQPAEVIDLDAGGVFRSERSPGESKNLPPGILNLIEKDKQKPTSCEQNNTRKVTEESKNFSGHVATAGSELSVVSGLSSGTIRSEGRKRRQKKDGRIKDLDNVKKRWKTHKDGSRHQLVSSSKDHSKSRLKKKKRRESSSVGSHSKTKPPSRASVGSRTQKHSSSSIKSRSEAKSSKRSATYITEYDRRHPPPPSDSSSASICRVAPRRPSLSSISAAGSVFCEYQDDTRSKRHHRSSKKSKRSHKNRRDSPIENPISGVSRSFWEPEGSDVSSVDYFKESETIITENKETPQSNAARIHERRESDKSYRKAGTGLINDPHDDTEDGEIVSSSDSFYSND